MKKFIVVVLMSITLVGCTQPHQVIKQNNVEYVNGLSYAKDSKTNLCYAFRSLGYSNTVLTNVPCTPEVEREIAK